MIGFSAETTGLPPALRVPARQHLQHTPTSPYSSKLAPSYPIEMVHTYIQLDLTTNWNLEASVMDPHWHRFQVRIQIQFRIRIQGFITIYCKNVQATGDAFSRRKWKFKTWNFLTFLFLWIFWPSWIPIRIQTPKSLRHIRIYCTTLLEGNKNLYHRYRYFPINTGHIPVLYL